jgi:hypothetical protein
MADKKSSQNPYQWPNGSWHSIPWTQHQANLAAQQSAAQAAAQNAANAAAAAQNAANQAAAKAAAPGPAATPAGAAPAPAAAGPVDTGPAAPVAVDPFFTPDDLLAISQFDTDLKTKLEAIDFDLGNLETDTTLQKTNLEKDAKGSTAAAQDDAAARGIFRSSVKDASLYDIEASRSLSEKFLNDKLTAARTNAGTNKTILGTAKGEFDKAMAARKAANASGVNSAANSAWADAKATWEAAQPVKAAATGPAPANPTFKPPAPPKAQSAAASAASNRSTQTAASQAAANRAKAKAAKKPKKTYG